MNINEQINKLVTEAKKDVAKAIKDSGKTRTLCLMTSKDATQMLAEWEELKVLVLNEHGIALPALLDGVTCSVSPQA